MKYTSTLYVVSVLLDTQVKAAGVPEYGQCGGLTWTGPKVCAPGLTCVADNLYYSHCHYVTTSSIYISTSSIHNSTSKSSSTSKHTFSSTSSTPSLTSSITSSSSSPIASLWSQCGGATWPGPTTCEPGSYCQKENDYFYICLAVPTTSSIPIATATGQTTITVA